MKKMGSSKKSCFVIGPIGKENSEIRIKADQLFKYIISPTVEKLGYDTPQRGDHIPNPGTITSQVIEQLIDSDLVIADLSTGNPNVFYELAVRHVTKKHCIHIVKLGDEIPFDTSSNRTIQYNLDLDGVEHAKLALEEQINSLVEGKEEVDNPIGIALTMKDLKSSGNSMQIMMADLTEEVRDLRGEMRSFQSLCKEMTISRNIHSPSEKELFYFSPNISEPWDSVLLIDPALSTKEDLVRARKEYSFLERKLSNSNKKGDQEQIVYQISSLNRWINQAMDR